MSPKKLIIALLLAAALLAGLFVAMRSSTPAEPVAAFVLPAPLPLPEFSLVDQFDNEVNAETFEKRWHLVFFGFTHCPDICPATLQILAAARARLAENGHAPLPRIVLVSVDPERDTPAQIGKYVGYFGDDNLGVTGSLDELLKLTSALGIYFEKQAGDNDNYAVDHSAAVLLFNPAGRFHALFSGPHKVDDYVHDIPLITKRYP
ncbi:MAG: SCO family protein [Gammaproteobacteria bacterium]|nr:SCO family protein [Gammaproteobacteria bacterium]